MQRKCPFGRWLQRSRCLEEGLGTHACASKPRIRYDIGQLRRRYLLKVLVVLLLARIEDALRPPVGEADEQRDAHSVPEKKQFAAVRERKRGRAAEFEVRRHARR